MSGGPRIAIVAPSAPPYSAGGVASAHYNLFRAMQRAGLEVQLFTFLDNEALQGVRDGVQRHGTPAWQTALAQAANRVLGWLQPGRAIFQTRDILAAQGGAQRMMASIADYRPDVLILSDHGAPGIALPRQMDAKVILVSHHNPARFRDHPGLRPASSVDISLARWFEGRALRRVDAAVCPSHYMQDWFHKTYAFQGPVTVIPNVLDQAWLDSIEAQDPRPSLGLNSDDLLVYAPSAGRQLKGGAYLPALIHCLADQTQDPIAFYIPSQIEPAVAAQLVDLPENVALHTPGQQPYEGHIAIVKSCSFGVSPSLLENYSMALLEAVTCGVPMAAFDTGGNSDIIQDGRNGYLAAEGDGPALCEQAAQFLDRTKLKTLKREGAAYSRQHFDAQQAVQDYLDLIQTL